MKVFLTGASGFVGGEIARVLLQREDVKELRLLARSRNSVQEFDKNPKCVIVNGSLSDRAVLEEAATDVDIVIHCAALASDWGTYNEFFTTNVIGTRNILQAVLANINNGHPLQRFVHISTVDAYGYPIDARHKDESTPLVMTNLPYNKTKALAEVEVREAEKKGLPVTIIRPANVYGPGGKDFVEEICNLLFERSMLLINGGTPSAGLVYVSNLAENIIAAALSPNTIGKAYNMSDESGDVTWKQYSYDLSNQIGAPKPWLSLPFWLAYGVSIIMEGIWGILGIKTRPLMTRHAVYLIGRDQWFPIERAKKDFGYKERVSYHEGVARSAQWYLNHKRNRLSNNNDHNNKKQQ